MYPRGHTYSSSSSASLLQLFHPFLTSSPSSLLSQYLWRSTTRDGKTTHSSAFGVEGGIPEVHTTAVRSRDTNETDIEYLAASSSLLCQKGDKSNMVTYVKAQAYSIAQAIQADIDSGNKVYSDLSYDVQRSVDFYNQNATAPQRTKHAVAIQVFREWPFRLRQMMDSDAGHAFCLSPLKSIPPRVYHYRL